MKSSFFRVVVVALLFSLAGCDARPSLALPPQTAFVAPQSVVHRGRIRDFDVLHYRVEAAVDPEAKSYEGRVKIRFRSLIPGFRTLRLDCGDNELKQASMNEMPLAFERDVETMRIGLPKALGRGEEAEVSISFAGIPSRGIYFFGPDRSDPARPHQVYTQGECEDMRYVFPCYDFPDDKASSELLLAVPGKYKTVAAGELVTSGPDSRSGWRQDHWSMETPHSVYLFTMAVGEFVEVREEWDGIPILYYGEPGDEESLRRSFGKTPQAMKFFSDYIGVDYPYTKYSQVCVRDFSFGGMENISATTQTRRTLHEASSYPIADSTGLMAHELAHQWWGNLLTCSDWSEIWLNEGFATYFEALFRESDRGREDFLLAMRGHQEAALEGERKESRPVVYDRYIDPLDLFFGGHVYAGGSARLHLLRHWLGDDRFRGGISLYAKRHREKNVTTEDFRDAMESASGEDLGTFFAQWFYGKGFPEFRVRWEWDEKASSTVLRVEQTQAGDPFVLPVDVALVLSEQPPRMRSQRIWVRDRSSTFVFPVEDRPLLSRFDVGGFIPKTMDEEKSPDEWIYQLRKDEDPIGRLEAAKALGGLLKKGGEAGIEPLVRQRVVESLRARFEEEKATKIREQILESLVAEPTAATRDFLLANLSEPEPFVRRKTIWALGYFGADARVAEALRKFFEKEPNAYVAAEVATALARKRSPKAGEFLLDAIEKDSDRDAIRAAAIAALAEIEHPEAAMQALRFAKPGNSYDARAAGIRALKRVGRGKKEALELLLSVLGEPNTGLRSAAAEALGEAGSSASVPALWARHAKEAFPPVRRAIEKAAAKLTR